MQSSHSPALWPVFGRLAWMMVCPLLLILMTYAIIAKGGGWLTLFDVVFFLAVAAMLAGRQIEFHAEGGKSQ